MEVPFSGDEEEAHRLSVGKEVVHSNRGKVAVAVSNKDIMTTEVVLVEVVAGDLDGKTMINRRETGILR